MVSIDGVTQEVYETYRVGGRLDRVMDNLNLLAEAKREMGSATPHVEWQFIVMRQNEHQMDEARALAGRMAVDSIVFKKVDFPTAPATPKWRSGGCLGSTPAICGPIRSTSRTTKTAGCAGGSGEAPW